MKTSELTGAALDWAVALAETPNDMPYIMGNCLWRPDEEDGVVRRYTPTEKWAIAGPIIEREKISVGYERYGATGGETWDAVKKASHEDTTLSLEYGPTPLIAAMRCYVASKLGDAVEIPEELR